MITRPFLRDCKEDDDDENISKKEAKDERR